MPRRPSRAQVTWAIVMVSVLVVGIAAWMVGAGRDPGDAATVPAPAVLADPTTTSAPAPSASTSAPRRTCATVARHFKPQTISVPGVTKHASVVTPPRDQLGVPGTPPLTTSGKSMVAWDRAQGIRPGDKAGNVLLNAHTWPDGTALGNRLLAGLHKGIASSYAGRSAAVLPRDRAGRGARGRELPALLRQGRPAAARPSRLLGAPARARRLDEADDLVRLSLRVMGAGSRALDPA